MAPQQTFLPTVPPSSGDSLVRRYRALAPADQALVELLVLDPRPIAPGMLAELLRLCAPEPEWALAKSNEVAQRFLKLREFVSPSRANEVRPRQEAPLCRAAVRGLLLSGRARRIAEALVDAEVIRKVSLLESSFDHALRNRVRIAALLGGMRSDRLALGGYYDREPTENAIRDIIALFEDDDGAAVALMPPTLAARQLAHLLWRQLLAPDARSSALYERGLAMLGDEDSQPVVWLPLFEHAVLRGDSKLASRLDDRFVAAKSYAQAAALLLDDGAAALALPMFESGLKLLRKVNGPRTLPLLLTGKLHLACLSIAEAPALIERRQKLAGLRDTWTELEGAFGVQAWQLYTQASGAGRAFVEPKLPLEARADDWWWLALLLRWSGQTCSKELRANVELARSRADAAGWTWLVAQIDSLDEQQPAAVPPLRDWVKPQPVWRKAIDALASALASDSGKATKTTAEGHSRLRILLNMKEDDPRSGMGFEVAEQRPRGDGFTTGRTLATPAGWRGALERVAPDDPDHRLLAAMISAPADGYYGYAASSRVVQALIDHPRVFASQPPHASIKVRAGEAALRAQRLADKRIKIAITPAQAALGEAFLIRHGDVIHIYRPDATLKRIGDILGEGLTLPEEAVGPLLQLLPDLGRKLRLDADLADFGIVERPAESGLVAQLETYRDGLSVRIVVCPLGDVGPALPPGEGAESVLGTVDGLPCRALRDLGAERIAFAVLKDSGILPDTLDAGERLEVESPDAALDLLGALQQQPNLTLAWRAGKPLRVSRAKAEGGLQVQVNAQRDWFAAKGGLALDDGSVIALSDVLRALPSAQGRYLRLDGDRVLALDGELRRRLQVLRSFADERGNVQVPKTAAFVLESMLDEDSQRDHAFREQLQKMEAAQDLRPPLPADFQAELRDYQIEGYHFLMRLAAWGGGACLADDMGLGKTVQALALLSARAMLGPALVIAPTSVVANWRSEARRFAPNLSLRMYGDGDREQALAELGNGDVVMVSYGMLASNIEVFAAIRFASLVLDEAQAIKNSATQRAQAVRQLNADFRMAATGTPLENHLGELWSLFRVLNPGLLGSEEQFRRRFLQPLERDPRAPQRETLRRLIGPFLLRRTKAEVLSELPPRTEIVISVEPSDGEARLLAALRRQAVQAMAQGAMPTEQRRFHILAELTRLRRAACHPMLVAPELGLPSSKLEQLVELVRELTDNRHRALVFSQFVDYLTLVRERLEAEGISYRYLDGSTPAKQRETEVAAFQAGEGSVFLLSLKAGGVGLNLTAADYVIHLDPWWNPAVEQQASDRAHRIGQTRPVTVYKLVLAGSIEEQILALHGAKRELIDQVIGEQATAAAISVDELLDLLND
ncbi:MAG: SNF2-related protein [Pseudomarimonas sp.]